MSRTKHQPTAPWLETHVEGAAGICMPPSLGRRGRRAEPLLGPASWVPLRTVATIPQLEDLLSVLDRQGAMMRHATDNRAGSSL